jgi:hypothetical protein
MINNRDNRMPETPLLQGAESFCGPSTNILDALDTDGVGEIDIAFERPLSHPRFATFDRQTR